MQIVWTQCLDVFKYFYKLSSNVKSESLGKILETRQNLVKRLLINLYLIWLTPHEVCSVLLDILFSLHGSDALNFLE